MKPIQYASKELLHYLFDWKTNEGQLIRFSIEKEGGRWVLSFFSLDPSEKDKHIFASFTGKDHDELKKWALDCLVNYKIAQTT